MRGQGSAWSAQPEHGRKGQKTVLAALAQGVQQALQHLRREVGVAQGVVGAPWRNAQGPGHGVERQVFQGQLFEHWGCAPVAQGEEE